MPHLSPINWMILMLLLWMINIMYLSMNWWNFFNQLLVVMKKKKKNDLSNW
uniref:ATP synthase F0 subunit 8 n=1 Tax=Haemadipsa tianmushana TaxID=2301367 RepID=A0A8F9WL63_9ANNE|nr:ATP synthase F0 subunit 8 [Haemadipsa tianmushana]